MWVCMRPKVEVNGRVRADLGAGRGEGASEERSRRASLGGVRGQESESSLSPGPGSSCQLPQKEGVGHWGHRGPRMLALRRWG